MKRQRTLHAVQRESGIPTGTLTIRAALLAAIAAALLPSQALATTYYVRQTVGNDANDGTSAEQAWQNISKLSAVMRAGDTAYVGPGLYRDQIEVRNDGTPAERLIFIADTTGQHTGDPPGVVMITGADPVDESVFVPHTMPGVYRAPLRMVVSVTQMDGPQYRYTRARDTRDHLIDKLSELDVVAKLPSSWYFDVKEGFLYIHTSDGKHPKQHEIEIMRRNQAFNIHHRKYVTVMGFTFRHMGDAAIHIHDGAEDVLAIGNTSYGGRQGIRVYNATRVLVYGNTLFRNDNSGVYFAKQSTDGRTLGNVAYENIKGLRWSSQSANAVAVDNTLFDNKQAGISIEDAHHGILRNNRIVNNREEQVFVWNSNFSSENNCFDAGADGSVVAMVNETSTQLGRQAPERIRHNVKLRSLAEYQQTRYQDLHSREGNCGPLPKKVDVEKLHADTMGYTERARRTLSASAKADAGEPGAGDAKTVGAKH